VSPPQVPYWSTPIVYAHWSKNSSSSTGRMSVTRLSGFVLRPAAGHQVESKVPGRTAGGISRTVGRL
jgi:hypothetical protein